MLREVNRLWSQGSNWRRSSQAVEAAGDAFAYFYDRQTGETVCLPDPLITGLEDEPLVELLENSPGRFLPIPDPV